MFNFRKGHVEMRTQTVEAVEVAVSHQKVEIVRLERDCRHFSSFLADVMIEVHTLRNKYEDWEEWGEAKGEDADEGVDGDPLSGWYRADKGYREAAGVGLEDLDYSERVRRAVAPLTGPLPGRVEEAEAQDLVAAAKKAALAAALATTEACHHTKASEKRSVPSFPKGGEMTNWIYSLGTGVVAAGFYGDGLEVTWIRECWTKSFDQLESSDLDGAKEQIRWKRLDFSISRALQGMVKSSGESLSEDVTLKAREYAHKKRILRGRQIIWMMIDYFKTSRSLQDQNTWQDIDSLHWQGDEKLQWLYTRWKLITTSLSIAIPEAVLRDTFLSMIRSPKKLQPDLVELDRMREDDSRMTLKWLTESIVPLLARERMVWARQLQKEVAYERRYRRGLSRGPFWKRQRRRQTGQRKRKR